MDREQERPIPLGFDKPDSGVDKQIGQRPLELPDVPVHFTRFHPEYLLTNLPETPVATLERAKAIADAEGLHYVYIGNVPGHSAENTYCPKCRRVVIERVGFTIAQAHLKKGKCEYCHQAIPGVWS